MDFSKCAGFLLFIGSLVLITSCDKIKQPLEKKEVNWLVGTWVVDRDETTENFISGALERLGLQGDGLTAKLATIAATKQASSIVSGVIEPLDNLEFKFTEDFEYSKEAAGFGGEGKPYKIISRPASNQITISEGGKNRTYTKEGKRIWYKEDIRVGNIKIYLTKISK